MWTYNYSSNNDFISHYGVSGMKWGHSKKYNNKKKYKRKNRIKKIKSYFKKFMIKKFKTVLSTSTILVGASSINHFLKKYDIKLDNDPVRIKNESVYKAIIIGKNLINNKEGG